MSASLTSPAARALQRLLEGAPIEATVRARPPKHNRATRTPSPKWIVDVPRARTQVAHNEGSWPRLFNLVQHLQIDRGPKQMTPHGPLQRLLDGTRVTHPP